MILCAPARPGPACRTHAQERGATRTAKGCKLPLHRGSELLPQVVEAVVEGLRDLRCGLTVQLLWLPLVQGGQEEGAGGGQEEGAGGGGGGDGARVVAGGAEGVCQVPVLHVML